MYNRITRLLLYLPIIGGPMTVVGSVADTVLVAFDKFEWLIP